MSLFVSHTSPTKSLSLSDCKKAKYDMIFNHCILI